jgi:hypothetical protein
MQRRRHTPDQEVRKLREADRLLAEGKELPEVAKALEISEATHHRWRTQFGGIKADDARRLKDLERENTRLKRMVADRELEIDMLKEIARGNVRPRSAAGGPWWPLTDRFGVSERFGCKVVGQHRSTQRHCRRPPVAEEDAIRTSLREISRDRPRWGWRRAHVLLCNEGFAINRKRAQGLWRCTSSLFG